MGDTSSGHTDIANTSRPGCHRTAATDAHHLWRCQLSARAITLLWKPSGIGRLATASSDWFESCGREVVTGYRIKRSDGAQ
eukprot:5502506-Pyramimonas_sp.AAC.1